MPISDLSNEELDRFEANYRRANKREGGIYSLGEILLEKMRRKPNPFGVREVAAKIIELAGKSPDGLATYGDIWNAFRPGVPWEGHHSQRIVADSLARVIHYCIVSQLPILTVLVVRSSNRRLTNEAVENIANECRELGLDVGLDPNAFVSKQAELSRAFVADSLPHARE